MIRLQCIGWGDLLASYNGTAITYDAIGNPLSYYNGSSYTFTWDGRRLATAVFFETLAKPFIAIDKAVKYINQYLN